MSKFWKFKEVEEKVKIFEFKEIPARKPEATIEDFEAEEEVVEKVKVSAPIKKSSLEEKSTCEEESEKLFELIEKSFSENKEVSKVEVKVIDDLS